jgi:ABC-type transport system involved in cytochrome bd biosynthesis fused ATPase/permease subunit
MDRYPFFLPTMLAFMLTPVVLMVAPVLQQWGRRLALLVAVFLVMFCAYGWAKTYAVHYQWHCVTQHEDMCNNNGDGAGSNQFGMWMVRHFA